MNCGVKHKVYGIVVVLNTTCSGKRRAEKVRPEIFKWFCQCLINVLNCNNHVNLLLRKLMFNKHQIEVSRYTQTGNSGSLIGKKNYCTIQNVFSDTWLPVQLYVITLNIHLALNHVHKDCIQNTCIHSLEFLAFWVHCKLFTFDCNCFWQLS